MAKMAGFVVMVAATVMMLTRVSADPDMLQDICVADLTSRILSLSLSLFDKDFIKMFERILLNIDEMCGRKVHKS